MFKIQTLNQISVTGLDMFPRDQYEIASELNTADAILVRSTKVKPEQDSENLKAIARAGAGVNNIDIPYFTKKGVVVFNTPGANANAVKELVLAGLFLGSRGIVQGLQYANSLEIKDPVEMNKVLEKEKKRFKGKEIYGKTLGVVGLGAIGSLVANTALKLGMNVIGYDPAISIEAAWRLSSEVQKMDNLQSLFAKADFITLHLPAIEATKNLVNADLLATAKKGAKLLNFARGEIVDNEAILAALESEQLESYITDFPAPNLLGNSKVILTPHIGASTDEAEDNCAVMAAKQTMDFLENGNITNSVNFPSTYLERSGANRIALTNKNIPKMLGSVTTVLASHNLNVIDMINKSRDDIAYNLIDIDGDIDDSVIDSLRNLEGVVNVRVL